MTPKQFIKTYVSKELQFSAEEALDHLQDGAREEGFEEGRDEVVRSVRGLMNQVKEW